MVNTAWPPQSPDVNPIEQVWDELDRRVKAKQPTSATFTGIAVTPPIAYLYCAFISECNEILNCTIFNRKNWGVLNPVTRSVYKPNEPMKKYTVIETPENVLHHKNIAINTSLRN